MSPWTHRYAWGNNPVRASRRGQLCRILIRSTRMASVLLEFPDGFRMVTSRRALRRPDALSAPLSHDPVTPPNPRPSS